VGVLLDIQGILGMIYILLDKFCGQGGTSEGFDGNV
jgi:hypothetical protein